MTIRIGALDDDEGILFTLDAMARSQGWHMLTTTDPDICLAWTQSGEIDLLLLDVHMPKAGGIDVLRRVKAANPRLAVLMLTVEERPGVAQECLLQGADDFINKPIRLADFCARIRLHEQLVRHARDLHWEQNKKGQNVETLRRVLDALREAGGPLDIEAVAERCAVSYPTAHRYLEQLAERGLAARTFHTPEGRPGRPKTRYTFTGGS